MSGPLFISLLKPVKGTCSSMGLYNGPAHWHAFHFCSSNVRLKYYTPAPHFQYLEAYILPLFPGLSTYAYP